jgi:hypothetical protein
MVRLVEPTPLHILGPEALHHPVEVVDVEIAAVGEPAATVPFPARPAKRAAPMACPLAPGRHVLDALVSDFELVCGNGVNGMAATLRDPNGVLIGREVLISSRAAEAPSASSRRKRVVHRLRVSLGSNQSAGADG